MPRRIIITPDETIISSPDGVEEYKILPDSISIVLEDGQMFSISQVVEILEKQKKVKKPSKFSKFRKAFKSALEEVNDDDVQSVPGK